MVVIPPTMGSRSTAACPKELSLSRKIREVNNALNLLGRSQLVNYHDYTASELLEVQLSYPEAKIEVAALPAHPGRFYLFIQVGQVKIFSVDYDS